MALKIVTGGTTGLADGTLVSSGNPLVITALNTAIDAHMRCDDGYWSNDQAFDMPAELQVSFDGGSTWKGNADEPITAAELYAVNVPIKVRQTAAAASTSGSFVTNGTYTAISALAQVTGASVTRTSGTQSDLSWSAVTNRTYYKVERATDSGFTANLTTLTSTGTATTYSDTTCVAGTTYYYRVTALGTGRYSNGTASATLTSAHYIETGGTLLDSGFNSYANGDNLAGAWTLQGSGTSTRKGDNSHRGYSPSTGAVSTMGAKLASGTTDHAGIIDTSVAGASVKEWRFWAYFGETTTSHLFADAASTLLRLDFNASGNITVYQNSTVGGYTAGFNTIGTYAANTLLQWKVTLDYSTKKVTVASRSALGGAWTYYKKTGESNNDIPFRDTSVSSWPTGAQWITFYSGGVQGNWWVDEIQYTTTAGGITG